MVKMDLRQGDCLELMKDIPDKSIDMILCDLPYGTTQNKWDIIIPFDKLWEQYRRIIKDNGAVVLFFCHIQLYLKFSILLQINILVNGSLPVRTINPLSLIILLYC